MQSNSEKEIWIFLSHSNKDFEKVRKIRNYLEEKDCRPLMFYLKCLSNDDEINDLIRREIDCRTRFIICDSENARASKWVQSEINYIKSKARTFEVLDLSASDDIIKQKLDLMINSSRIFVSYSRRDIEIVRSVISHVRKYDIRLFWDGEDFGVYSGSYDFVQTILTALSSASQVFVFASRNYFSSEWARKELEYADKENISCRFLILDDFAKAKLFEGNLIRTTDSLVDLSHIHEHVLLSEMAIEAIVNWTMRPWDVYTMAKNFLGGIGCSADVAEANRLFRIAYSKADELDTKGHPGGTLVLARCEANGYGTARDLHSALSDYQNYIHAVNGSNDVKKEMERVRQMLEEGK